MNVFQQAILENRQHAAQSLQMQQLQAGLLMQISSSLHSIHGELAEIKRHMADALAIQQEILVRERLQAYLEEFIYQGQKLVVECSAAKTDIPPSTRYFLLRAIVLHVGQEGIATPIIKGRENKAAFDKMMQDTRNQIVRLNQDPEVIKAIEWADQLKSKMDREREEERQRRRREERLRTIEEEKEAEKEAEMRAAAHNQTLKILGIVGASVFALIILSLVTCVTMSAILGPRKR